MKTKRKNLAFFILVMVLFAMNDLSAQTYVKTFTFRFPESSFTLEKNEGGDYILPDEAQYNWTYGEDTSKPNQTYICYQILLPDNYKIKDFTFSSDNNWFAEDVTLMPNPTVAPISTEGTGEQSSYPLVKYPAEVICTSEGLMDGYRIADFSINPFTYHADNKKLALASSLMLEITIEPIEGEKVEHTGSMTNIVQDIVINPEDFGMDTENWMITSRPFPQWTEIGELKFGETMYMLNVGAGKFFCGGNAWNTQTSVGTEGHKVYFEKYLANGTWDGTTVYFRNYVETKGGQVMDVFFDNVDGGCYVDRGAQMNHYWKLEKNTDNDYYRLSMAEANPDYQAWQTEKNPGTYFGWDAANGTVASAFLNPADEGVHVDWTFLSVEQYEEYRAAISLYEVAQELYALIGEAKEKGIDTREQETVYANEAATTDELKDAIATVTTAITNLYEQNVDPAKPINLTQRIVNPNYDDNDNTGWSGTTPIFQTYTNAEHYNKTFDTWQVVENLPNGVYKLTVQGLYRPTNCNEWNYNDDTTPQYAVFYAANGTDSLTTPVPNVYEETSENETVQPTMKYAAEQFAKEKYYADIHLNVMNGKVRIGLALPQLAGSSDWVCWDNWQLTYYGNREEESYNGVVKEMIDANLTRFDTVTAKISTGIIETYKTTVKGLTATDIAGINKAKQTIEDAISTVEANMEAWEEYLILVKRGEECLKEDNFYCWNKWLRTLDDHIKDIAPTFINRDDVTTAELQVETEILQEHIESGMRISRVPLVNAVWSYINFDRASAEEKIYYTRYQVLDKPIHIERVTYFPLVKYTSCEYQKGEEIKTYRIRMEDNRVYILKEDAPDSFGDFGMLEEEGKDYILYDFNLKVGEDFGKYENGESLNITERSSVTTMDGETFNTMNVMQNCWIEGIGSTYDFLTPLPPLQADCNCGSILNYFKEPIYGTEKIYKNPFGDIFSFSIAFQDNDCALNPNAIKEIIKQNSSAQINITASTILCTSPDAVKMEVYTMDAVKVGEARFTHGQAEVKVNNTPATYLYIVTYPDGRRESGKVVMKGEG